MCLMSTLEQADRNARRAKEKTRGVLSFDRNREENLKKLQQTLINCEYKTSNYHVFKIHEPKEREIYELPYYPDRIVHHAIMLMIGDMFLNHFESNTFSSIKGKGGSALRDKMIKILKKDKEGTRYCLKLDIKKCFNNIDNETLKYQLRRKIKDSKMLGLIFEIIDSAKGLPIGNYLSQTFANFYLSELDTMFASRYYFRYTDDIVVLANSKEQLREDFEKIKSFMNKVKMDIKSNWQIFPVDARGIDYAGYVFYHGYTKIRKSIKLNMIKAVKKYKDAPIDVYRQHLGGYCGWLIYTNSINLNNKYKILWKQKALSH